MRAAVPSRSDPQSAAPVGVDLWLSVPDAIPASRRVMYCDWLDAGERARLDRTTAPQVAEEFLIGRALLRDVLSRYTAVARADWRFTLGRHGRPYVDPACGAPADLFFNLSHTAGLVVLAVANVETVGVDMERVSRTNRLDLLLDRSFTADEAAMVRAAPDASAFRERFFAIWTMKEAFIKAKGTGLALPLRSFTFTDTGERPGVVFHDAALGASDDWAFRRADVSPDHRLALCASPAQTLAALRAFRVVPGAEDAEPIGLSLSAGARA